MFIKVHDLDYSKKMKNSILESTYLEQLNLKNNSIFIKGIR